MSSRKERFLKTVVKSEGKAEGRVEGSNIGSSRLVPSSSLTHLPLPKPFHHSSSRPLYSERTVGFPLFRSSVVQTKHQILTALKELRASSSATLSLKQGRRVYQIFSALAEEKGYYQEEMQLLVGELRRLLFLPRSSLPPDILSYLTHKDLDLLIQEDNLLPHYYLVQHLLTLLHSLTQQSQQTHSLMESRIQALEALVAHKDTEADNLKVQIRKFTEERRPLEVDRERLRDKSQRLAAEGDSLRIQLKRLEEKYAALKGNLHEDLQTIADLEDKVKGLKQTVSDSVSNYKTLEEDHVGLIAAFTAVQGQQTRLLEELKERNGLVERLEEEQRELEAERMTLRKRATGGFEDLTPRIQYEELYDALGAERQSFSSTAAHITELLKCLQGLPMLQSPRTRVRKKTNAPLSLEPRSRTSIPQEEVLFPSSEAAA